MRQIVGILIFLACCGHSFGEIAFLATDPPSMAVRAGERLLVFDPPEIATFRAQNKKGELPDAPGAGKRIGLTPPYDATRTHILGNFFRTFRPESLAVASADGAPYRRDADFSFREDDGTICNKDGRMTGKIAAEARGALQRLDLIQRDPSEKLSVKKGVSAWVCPELPAPDPECTALAGIYIAPWRAARNPFYDADPEAIRGAPEYAITPHEIFPLRPAASVAPIHPERVARVAEKLRDGETVKVAFMGDSITLGAESTRWWNDAYDADSKTWKGRVIHGLRQRFPDSSIEVIEAYKGGVTIDYGLEKLPWVLAQKPDLVIASFGVNDADRTAGKRTPDEFGEALATLVGESEKAGAEFLFILPFPIIPWVNGDQGRRLENDFLPVMKRVASEKGAALADVNAEFKQLGCRGIPWWSQNHNWHNHPGDFGHGIYAEAVLRFFPVR